MAKIRITITGTYEFDPDELPDDAYEPGATLEQKLQAEIDSAKSTPIDMLLLDTTQMIVTGEIVP